MLDLYNCPTPTVISAIGNPDCPVMPGNIQAIAFQLKGNSTFTSSSIALQATWTPALALSTSAGIRVVQATSFESTPGEPITEGGNDQTTYKGRPKLKYLGFTACTYMLSGITPALAKQIMALTQFSAKAGQRSSLTAFFLTDDNYVISNEDYKGIEIFNHVVQDVKKGGGYKLEDNYTVTFGIDAGWSFGQAITKASFNVLDLVNA